MGEFGNPGRCPGLVTTGAFSAGKLRKSFTGRKSPVTEYELRITKYESQITPKCSRFQSREDFHQSLVTSHKSPITIQYGHFQFLISGMSSPYSLMYCL
jgi:hypothetical protein